MMQGFLVHSFIFVNAKGERTFFKGHWRPLLGVHGLAWDEAVKINGADPDFHRRDLYEAIAMGQFPEYEFGVQLVPEADEHKFDFDLLDATKVRQFARTNGSDFFVPVEFLGTYLPFCAVISACWQIIPEELVPIKWIGKMTLDR
jgi:catalase